MSADKQTLRLSAVSIAKSKPASRNAEPHLVIVWYNFMDVWPDFHDFCYAVATDHPKTYIQLVAKDLSERRLYNVAAHRN